MTATTHPGDDSILKFIADAISSGVSKASMISDKKAFESGSRSNSLPDFRLIQNAKVAGVGGLTGLLGGPIGLALEGADLAFLFSTLGRACFGIGAIINKRAIDYDADIPAILAVWSGAATAVPLNTANAIVQKSTVKIVVMLGGTGAGYAATIGAKVLSKAAFKTGGKLAGKAMAMAAAKLGAKLAARLSVKWIPLVGGVVSGAINVWVISGIMDAAEEYYRADALILDESFVS